MSIHGASTASRLSRRSTVRETSALELHLGNDRVMRKLVCEGTGVNQIQKRYISLCYAARPPVRPAKGVVEGLGRGELIWDFTAVTDKGESAVLALLLREKDTSNGLRSLVISASRSGCVSARKSNLAAKRRIPSGIHAAPPSLDKDTTGEVLLFNALCKALPQLDALRSLELDGIRKAFGKAGEGAAKLARGLKSNSRLKALRMLNVSLSGRPGMGALATALASHPSLVSLSLVRCGLRADPGARLVAVVIKAHAGRRNALAWSNGLRRPPPPPSLGALERRGAGGGGGSRPAGSPPPAHVAAAGLLVVDVSGNRLGDAGVHAIAKGLQNDSWIVGINLSHNGVTNRGAALLSLCLQHNSTLCGLVLDDNPDIGNEADQLIAAELGKRNSLLEVVLEEPEVVLTLALWGFSATKDNSVGGPQGLPLPVNASGSGGGRGSLAAWEREGGSPDLTPSSSLGRCAGTKATTDKAPIGSTTGEMEGDEGLALAKIPSTTKARHAVGWDPQRLRSRSAPPAPRPSEGLMMARKECGKHAARAGSTYTMDLPQPQLGKPRAQRRAASQGRVKAVASPGPGQGLGPGP
ncbi:unnamed protein product, partial [Discosporangium mesarthrocarpum]